MGATRVNDNRQVVMTYAILPCNPVHIPCLITRRLDHDVQNDSEQNLRKYRLIEEFAKKQGIDFCMLALPGLPLPKIFEAC